MKLLQAFCFIKLKPQVFGLKCFVFLVVSILISFHSIAQVGIGTLTPDASAELDISSSTKGVLFPRMTEAQRDFISTPAEGLVVYCLDCETTGLFVYRHNQWKNISDSVTNDITLSNKSPIIAPSEYAVKTYVDNSFDNNGLQKYNTNVYGSSENFHFIDSYGPRGQSLKLTEGNVAVGNRALRLNLSGNENTAIGNQALMNGWHGTGNTAIGSNAMSRSNNPDSESHPDYREVIGGYNTAVGLQALHENVSGTQNVALGYNAMYDSDSASFNLALGSHSLYPNKNGEYNIALGHSAMGNAVGGDKNTAIGRHSLYFNITGTYNVAIGDNSLYRNTLGSYNIGLGTSTLYSLTQGKDNIAIGYQSQWSNTIGFENISIGKHALDENPNGERNVAIGSYVMDKATSGKWNTSIGAYSSTSLVSGDVNTVIGYKALHNATAGTGNVAIGAYAGYSHTGNDMLFIESYGSLYAFPTAPFGLIVGNFAPGSRKVGINRYADSLHSNAATLSVGGDLQLGNGIGAKVNEFSTDETLSDSSHIAIPTEAAVKGYIDSEIHQATFHLNSFSNDATLANNSSTDVPTEAAVKGYVDNNSINAYANNNWYHASQYPSTAPTGCCNIAYGLDALGVNSTGGHNTALGHNSLQFNVGGSYNVGLGSGSLRSNTTGSGNIAIGRSTMDANTTGSWNTILGFNAGASLLTGFANVAMGHLSLKNNISGNYNTALGSGALQHSTGSGHVAIGYAAGSGALGDNLLFIENSQSLTPLIGGNFSSDNVGINMPVNGLVNGETLQVGGNASKSSGGNWLANSDKRLKKNIEYLNAEEMLNKMLQLKGATYLWNDTVTGTPRPEGIQYGFIAQNIEKVWPTKITKDGFGYLMAAYGDYDPMFVESIRALNNKIEKQNQHIEALQVENQTLKTSNEASLKEIKAELKELKSLLNQKETSTPLQVSK